MANQGVDLDDFWRAPHVGKVRTSLGRLPGTADFQLELWVVVASVLIQCTVSKVRTVTICLWLRGSCFGFLAALLPSERYAAS